MSSLKRYKKTGGFVQLLSLIETFGGQKKAKFIDMIEAEDPAWAKLLNEKMLSVERIYSWPDQVVIEILKNLPAQNLAWVMEAMESPVRGRMTAFFSGSEMRKMEDIRAAQKNPRPEDLAGHQVRMIELTRKLLLEGTLRAEKIDAALVIPEGVEARLEELAVRRRASGDPGGSGLDHHVYGADEGAEAPETEAPAGIDMVALKKTIQVLVKKNQELSAEVRLLSDKLEQIRKIA